MAVAIVGMGYAHALPISLQIVDFSAMEEPMEHMETVFYQREVLSFVCVTQVCGLASRRMFSMFFERSIVYPDPRAEILGVVIFGKWHAVSGCPLSVQCIFTMYIHCLPSHPFFFTYFVLKTPATEDSHVVGKPPSYKRPTEFLFCSSSTRSWLQKCPCPQIMEDG